MGSAFVGVLASDFDMELSCGKELMHWNWPRFGDTMFSREWDGLEKGRVQIWFTEGVVSRCRISLLYSLIDPANTPFTVDGFKRPVADG